MIPLPAFYDQVIRSKFDCKIIVLTESAFYHFENIGGIVLHIRLYKLNSTVFKGLRNPATFF